MKFIEARYWDLEATFKTTAGETFPATLHSLDGNRLIAGKDFDPDTGQPRKDGVVWLKADEADSLRIELEGAAFSIPTRCTRSPGI